MNGFSADAGEPDTLVFTGGSSRLNSLQQAFKSEFTDAVVLYDSNFYNSISHGLAIHAYNL